MRNPRLFRTTNRISQTVKNSSTSPVPSVLPKDISDLAFWYDPSAELYNENDLVATLNDQSDNNVDATTSGTQRPTFKTNVLGGKAGLLYSGGQYFNIPAIVGNFNAVTLFVVALPQTSGAIRWIYDSSTNANSTLFMYHENGTSFDKSFVGGIYGNMTYHYHPSQIMNSPAVISGIFDISTNPDGVEIYVDGTQNGTPTTNNNTIQITLPIAKLGCRANTTAGFTGYMFDVIMYKRRLTPEERAQIEFYLQYKYQMTVMADRPFDNAHSEAFSSYTLRSVFSRNVFRTTATQFRVDFYSSVKTPFWAEPGWWSAAVWVDGVYNSTVSCAFDSRYQSGLITGLPAGLKTIELMNGLQSKPAATVIGSWVQKIVVTGEATQVAPREPTNRIVIYGDSIAVGDYTSFPGGQAWPVLVRQAYAATGGVAVEAWGYRALYDDAATPELRTAFVSSLLTAYPAMDKFWMAIGTNDAGLSRCTAATFGTIYAATVDLIHSQSPDTIIYCQTPLNRGDGVNLTDYRTQIGTLVSTREPWCVLVDGTAAAFPQPGTADFYENVHPNIAGNVKYANAVKTILGIS